jgi:hypothetical protein
VRHAVPEGPQAVSTAPGKLDSGVIDAFVIVPPLVAVAWLLLLSGRFDEAAAAVLWVMFGFALRPVIWFWAAQRPDMEAARVDAYRERRHNSTNTAFIATALIGLAALDVVRLPGAPYWIDQPRASFALAAVAVYLTWLAFASDIPVEVAAGWRGMLGKRQEGRHA